MDGLPGTWFHLSSAGKGVGVSCGEHGLFVGDVPLLEPVVGPLGAMQWRPRSLAEIDDRLSKCFDLPIEFAPKMSCLAAVARALDRGDIALAQIAALQLQIPDPPALSKSARSAHEVMRLPSALHAAAC